MASHVSGQTSGTSSLQTVTAFDFSSDIIIGLTDEGIINAWNAAASSSLGFAPGDIVGHPITRVFPELNALTLRDCRPDSTGVPDGCCDMVAHHSNGTPTSFSLCVSPVYGEDHHICGFWIVAKDNARKLRTRHIQQPLIDCARLVGEPFLEKSVEVLAGALKVRWVIIAETSPDRPGTVRTVRFWADGALQANMDYPLAGSPCAQGAQNQICFIRSDVAERFPDDAMLAEIGAHSYLGVPLHSSTGSLIGLISVLHDGPIDEHIQPALILELFAGRAAAELERLKSSSSVERLGRIVEDAASEAFLFDADTINFIMVNRGARENLGYTMEELRSLTAIDIKPRISADAFRALIAPLLAGEQKVLAFETVHRRKDGSEYNVAVQLQLLVDQQQKVFYAAIEDVTESNRTLDELRSVTNRLDTVLNNTSMAVFLMDDRQRCIYLNDAAERLTGFRHSEIEGRILHDVPTASRFRCMNAPSTGRCPKTTRCRAKRCSSTRMAASTLSLIPQARSATNRASPLEPSSKSRTSPTSSRRGRRARISTPSSRRRSKKPWPNATMPRRSCATPRRWKRWAN